MSTDAGLLSSLTQLREFGISFIRNVPTQEGEVARVAQRIGPIRDTFYGRHWDVRSVKNAKNIAYTSLDLMLHQDLMYFEAPPGLQFLHALEVTVPTGGESLFVDGFRVAETLRRTHPHHFDTLVRVPVTYNYVHPHQHRIMRHPIISFDPHNAETHLFYSPPFEGPLDVPPEDVVPFYEAYREFTKLVDDPQYRLQFRLQAGDLVAFNNRRLLHGRTGFDPSSGNRHLQGTYVDWDDFKSRASIIRRLCSTQTPSAASS
ncbi:gamma-butyrobetaine dioxygenase [Capsaspora owczarzaki ATCC 30864]|uniref:Gamma-butyrobetaine dioxygenase n=1 Tax=Capsaspora owczarzaki (strain ATCC 30864) TaxID=595528 RepID=A0A0D2VT37_CAPO3|nr:gamma-butyrobetaine dioxygenase [Capsaspora owczarzaki ATCC 30864]KJE94377.1 gamma-butyrobetaine dioxygenase [Capsaspora owczarzaki ATCC 30864]|eukprot:XP_004346708.1 gamma-butyrobetaine dioxygenase [Capsaspora owczarzaki ATCC 30864]